MSITGYRTIADDDRHACQKLVPEANVAFAHGQMKEHELGADHV